MDLVPRQFCLRRSKMSEFLVDIGQFDEPGSFSIYIPGGLPILEIEDLLHNVGVQPFPANLGQLIMSSQNGAALLWGNSRKCMVLPPFPVGEYRSFSGYATEHLQKMINYDYLIGLILIHLGSYGIGICRGEELITSKVGTGLIHGRHKKGGSSQQRFQRHRDNQIREFLDRVCLHIKEHFEDSTRLIDYIVYGGPRQTILQLQKRCPLLKLLNDRVLPTRSLKVIRQRTLETFITRIWSSSVIEWREE